MQVTTSAFLLSYIKYGESSAILRFYTHKLGYKSLIWKAAFTAKNKKRSFLFPLNKVIITYRDKGFDKLDVLYNIERDKPLNTIKESVIKNTFLLLLSEVLTQTLKLEHENNKLFNFLENQINKLNTISTTKNYLQLFLLEYTKFLGIFPNNNYLPNSYFNYKTGDFITTNSSSSINKENSLIWYKFLSNKTDKLNPAERLLILYSILEYYKIQLPYFKKPNALAVLKEVFTNT